MKSLDAQIDDFVSRINSSARPAKLKDEVAPSVAEPTADPGLWSWSIRLYDVSWIDHVEAKLPKRFPEIFRSFAGRYIYPEFAWHKVLFFANTPEGIGYAAHELRFGIFRDEAIFNALAKNGFVQIGQPSDGSYDPVCFAPGNRAHDAAVVRIDHEDILIRGEVRVIEHIAPSFSALIAAPVV